jgi:ABC-2 type transport system ATP-binding protein
VYNTIVQGKSIVEITNFSKSFGDKVVISDLSFDVHEGEIFAFLGANGSGKTTTIRALLGIYSADSGQLLVNGKPYTPEAASLIGYLPEERGLYLNDKVLNVLVYFGQLKGLSAADAKSRALKYLERVELSDKANVKVSKLSSGQQQKIQLGVTVINNPKLLILDEPTKGLDPVNRAFFMEILQELNDQGSTIIFSTHQMDETEKIADRLLMLKDGKRILYGSVTDVRKSFGNNTIELRFKGKLAKENPYYSAKVERNFAELTPLGKATPEVILGDLLRQKLEILKFEITSPSLNEIFIKVSTDPQYE